MGITGGQGDAQRGRRPQRSHRSRSSPRISARVGHAAHTGQYPTCQVTADTTGAADTTKSVGEYWATFNMAPTTDFGGTQEPWSETVIWGTRLLHGTSVVSVRQAAWENR